MIRQETRIHKTNKIQGVSSLQYVTKKKNMDRIRRIIFQKVQVDIKVFTVFKEYSRVEYVHPVVNTGVPGENALWTLKVTILVLLMVVFYTES